MENHGCKLCFRSFANGKALGGHMRSHTMNFPSLSSSSSEEKEEKNTLLSSPFFRVYQDGESETDSSKKRLICRRSEMVRKSRISSLNTIKMEGIFVEEEKVKMGRCLSPFLDPESLSSSVSHMTDAEDAAHCLIMLSRDKRKRDEIKYQMEEKEDKFEEKDYSEDYCKEKVMKKNKVRANYYRCEICSKLFRSFKALGVHRASHDKIKVNNTRDSNGCTKSTAAVLERTVACPFCPRVFASGQAFGGHKRTHFIAATAKTIGPTSFSRNGECLNIDLNLPASFEDEILMQN